MKKVKIKEVCDISNGYAFKSEKYAEIGARVIRITNVQKGKIVDSDPKLYPFECLKGLEKYEIFEDEILMSLTGNVGRIGRFPKSMLPAFLNQRVSKIIPKEEKINKDFLFHFLNSERFENDAHRNSNGAAQLNLSTKWLEEYEIALPELSVQKKIATILNQAQEIRETNQQIVDKYEQLKQSLFLEMFGDPGKNEKGWEVRKLGDFFKNGVKCGPFGSALKKNEFIDDGVPVWNMDNIQNFEFVDEPNLFVSKEKFQSLSSYGTENGDIIISRAGTVGKMCIVNSKFEKSLISTNLIRLSLDEERVLPIYFVLAMKFFADRIGKLRRGKDDSFSHMGTGVLTNLEIQIPDFEIQKKFAKSVKEIDNQIYLIKKMATKTDNLFNALLQKAFSGNLI